MNFHTFRYVRLNLPQEVREEVGRKCKNIIDIGRNKYLESLGFKSKLLFYVSKNITLENVCVVATKNS
jgi:tRNA:m4X modification enzyme